MYNYTIPNRKTPSYDFMPYNTKLIRDAETYLDSLTIDSDVEIWALKGWAPKGFGAKDIENIYYKVLIFLPRGVLRCGVCETVTYAKSRAQQIIRQMEFERITLRELVSNWSAHELHGNMRLEKKLVAMLENDL